MRSGPLLLRYPLALSAVLLATGLAPAHAHQPVLRCVLLDSSTVRCRGTDADGESEPDASIAVITYAGRTLLSGRIGARSLITFARPGTPYYVRFDLGPGHQAIVEHDEIAEPEPDQRASWMRQ